MQINCLFPCSKIQFQTNNPIDLDLTDSIIMAEFIVLEFSGNIKLNKSKLLTDNMSN